MADKLPPLPALTLNRPPTQPRPVDTQRFQSIDMLDKEAAAADPEYQRMLKEIEAMQQRQGWLRGSGAFDKEDLLYLRDKESQQRQAELQQRDLEAAAYAAARARAERERQEAEHASITLQAKAAGGISSATGGSSSSSKAQPGRVPAPLQPVVKVKQRRSKPGSEADAADETAADETASKRPRLLESCAAGQPVAAGEQPQQGQQLQQEEQQLCEQQAEQHHASTDATAVAGPDKEATGLDALLGAYGSDSDDGSEDTSDEGAAAAAAAGGGPSSLTPAAGGATGRTVQLPSALQLLEQDMSGGFAEQHKQQQQQQQTGRSRVLGPKAAGTTSSSYQQQSGWI